VFDTVAAAVAATGATAALSFAPARGAAEAVLDCVAAGLGLIVCAAENVPLHDALKAVNAARAAGAWLVGPNTLGMAIPGQGMLGAFATDFLIPGPVGVISRSGSLTANTVRHLALAGCGQSACIHMGGDYLCGRNPGEYLEMFEADPETRVIAYCGEIGGTKEYDVVRRRAGFRKPLVAMIAGRSAPRGKRLGHAGALVLGDRDTAAAKLAALADAGVHVAHTLAELAQLCRRLTTVTAPAAATAPSAPGAA